MFFVRTRKDRLVSSLVSLAIPLSLKMSLICASASPPTATS